MQARFANQAIADEWVAWLLGEHIADVVAAGATSGRVIRLDQPLCYAAQYEFASAEALSAYLADQAPRLRAEGERRFGADQVAYARRTGIVLGL